jgi:hypothetical protein
MGLVTPQLEDWFQKDATSGRIERAETLKKPAPEADAKR